MSIRTERVARLIQRELAEIIGNDLLAGSQTLVTLTQVRVSKDLAIAYVYLSVLGRSDEERKAAFKHVKDSTPQLRSELGQRIRHQVRLIPELRLFLDDTELRAERIDQLIDRIQKERSLREDDSSEELSSSP